MKLSDIRIRDPFILLENDTYYMYGTRSADGFEAFSSMNFEDWEGPFKVFTKPDGFWADRNFWAPEVHKYKDDFYMLASFKSEHECRGTQILISDSPLGTFRVHSDVPVTPRDWECLDGTLYIEDDVPYMIFCHEWLQVKDGEMCAIRLSDDLKHSVGEPIILFTASQPDWALKDAETFVTDGPFMYRTRNGKLLMLWSSFCKSGYCVAIASSDNGKINGKWYHEPIPLIDSDGGHGMCFKTLGGQLSFAFHQPNQSPHERAKIIELEEINDMLIIKNIQ